MMQCASVLRASSSAKMALALLLVNLTMVLTVLPQSGRRFAMPRNFVVYRKMRENQ